MHPSHESVIEVEDLTFAYDVKPVLWDVDLEIPRGTLMAVVGPNGAGKTTLIKLMLGLLEPTTGRVRFTDDDPVIGYVPQSGSVEWDFPTTALDVVLMGTYGKLGWFRRPGQAERDLARAKLKQVGMEAYADRQIRQLSGGQQQRVFLARALTQEADIYFMDEPFKGVDAKTERAIVRILRELQAEGKTLIVVHHDLHTVEAYFDTVTLINIRIVGSGPVETIFTDELLQETYQSASPLLRRGGDTQ